MNTNDFINTMRENKNPDKSQAMENYMRNQFKFLGLQAAERRQLARPFLKTIVSATKESGADWNLLFTLWEQPEREFQLVGIDYLKDIQDILVPADLKSLRQLVLTKSWWDTVDFLSKNIGAVVQKEPTLIDEMLSWSMEENIWLRRVSILHQLAFKLVTNTDCLKQVILNNIAEEEFFIQKAIGWALREYAKTDETWVRTFTETYRKSLSKLSYHEATKNLN